MLTFYDFPAPEHWNTSARRTLSRAPSATVGTGRKRTKGCLSRETGLAMAFRLMMSPQAKWRTLDGRNRLPEVTSGVEFRDGVRQTSKPPPDHASLTFANISAPIRRWCCRSSASVGNLNQFTKQIQRRPCEKRGEFGSVVVALRYLARLVTIESGLTKIFEGRSNCLISSSSLAALHELKQSNSGLTGAKAS